MNVFITGASGGLGRALANECGKRGYNLFLNDINEPGLKSIQRGLERQFGVTVTTAACDLTREESVEALLQTIDSLGIRFDMLLNVAGLDFEGGFLERERKDILRIISLNNEATLRITHAILSRRRREGIAVLLAVYLEPCKYVSHATQGDVCRIQTIFARYRGCAPRGTQGSTRPCACALPRRACHHAGGHARHCGAGILGQRHHKPAGNRLRSDDPAADPARRNLCARRAEPCIDVIWKNDSAQMDRCGDLSSMEQGAAAMDPRGVFFRQQGGIEDRSPIMDIRVRKKERETSGEDRNSVDLTDIRFRKKERENKWKSLKSGWNSRRITAR